MLDEQIVDMVMLEVEDSPVLPNPVAEDALVNSNNQIDLVPVRTQKPIVGWRRYAPRWISYRWHYMAGRNYLRLYLGPVIVDLLVRRREGHE